MKIRCEVGRSPPCIACTSQKVECVFGVKKQHTAPNEELVNTGSASVNEE